jgi:tRNA modification GTPase
MAVLRKLRHPETREVLDEALVFWSAGPKSETGEDIAELHVHGGRSVVRAVLEALGRIEGCRMAEPGEFARRAFAHGRLDLAQAEGLADLIDAETDAQRRQALQQAGGAPSQLYEGWRARLVNAAALVEAAIDFSDETDVSSDAMNLSHRVIEGLADEVRAHLDDGHRGEIIRDGFRVALMGPPNAGKSSLLNALARREAAIVSAEAGTTRDVIEVRLDLGGYPVIVSDTAGIREAQGEIEQEGIRRSFLVAERADLVLWLSEAGSPPIEPPEAVLKDNRNVLEVRSKADLADPAQREAAPDDAIAISIKTGEGLDELMARLLGSVADLAGVARDAPVISSLRHRALLETCLRELEVFLAGDPHFAELRAEDLRKAASALGRITGRVDVEDVLDQVFSRFCIGK